jgi:cell division protein FtsI/penicillin-binding protein 2
MNQINKTINKTFILAMLLFITSVTQGQQEKKEKNKIKAAEIEQLINSKNFVFKAQSVNPTSGRTIQLTSDYDVQVSGEKVLSYLPYFGRAYVAPIDPSDGGIRFTSTDFTYNMESRKRGGWYITIIPKDTKDVRQMYLTISSNGYTNLQVLSNNRQPISYTGYIKARK